ncbi:MAG: hypothetical protein WCL71_03010 [Deltaproteobacteria bacterium]
MNKYLILAQADVTAKALRKIIFLSWPESELSPFTIESVVPAVVMAGRRMTPDEQFHHLAGRIQAALAGDGQAIPVGQVTILVDRFDVSKANPMQVSWDATIAMLILAFPEVRWIFGVLQGETSQQTEITRWHSVKAFLCGPQADPLFDGSGLRNVVRNAIACETSDSKKIAPYVPLRNSKAASLDDEDSYAYFNAYTAYRFGFRAFPVCRDVMAQALFGETENSFNPLLTFEDVYISYPDNSAHAHYSNLCNRSNNTFLPLLEHASYRIFVTTAHRHAGDGEKHDKNREYVESGRCVQSGDRPNRYGRILLKPFSGMFALWSGSRLAKRLRWEDATGRTRRGTAPDFVWPPLKCDGHDGDTGHSTPGRLLQMATHMIIRCEAMLMEGVHTVPDAVRCAVLATDALELLGDRTPTTAMDALKLKHMAEVTAECQFSGVEYHIEIKPRLKEIQKEARSLSRWFHHRRKTMAAMNAEMTTVIEVMRIFREHGQFDEALICQNRIRYLHNRLWMYQQPGRLVLWPLLRYTEIVLASFGCFLAAIAGWMFLFTMIFSWISKVSAWPADMAISPNGATPWSQAFSAFTSANSFTSTDFTWNLITVLAVLFGIAHIGIFISHVYMLVSRKD